MVVLLFVQGMLPYKWYIFHDHIWYIILMTGDKSGKYVGNKWGGKYLRTPDIFFTILEKAERYRFFEYEGEGVIVEDVTEMVEE